MVSRKREKVLKRVTLTLDPDDYASIDHLARRSEVSASWLIRRAVREFLEHHESDQRVTPSPLDGGKK